MKGDRDLGALVLVGNAYWKEADWRTRLGAWVFGKHEVFEHLGRRFRVSFYKDRPFLLTIRECSGLVNGAD